MGFGWGFSIIALTILIRALLLPLTFKQFHSMQRLAHLQPEMKKVQEKYKGDKERMNQEMMKFYRENKVNPFASCLPMVAQFPVFISLYYMLRTDLRRDICPEINGLGRRTTADPLWVDARVVVPVHQRPDGQGDRQHADHPDRPLRRFAARLDAADVDDDRQDAALIFLALPFIFVTFVIQFPAGLLVYWITTNMWTVVQQLIIKKRLGPLRPPTPPGEKEPSLFDSFRTATAATDSKAGTKPRVKEPAKVGGNEPKGRRRPAALVPAEEEETFGETAMSASGDRVKDLLEHLSDALALQATVVIEEDGRNIRATLEGEDLGLFIGRHGQTIDAVQHLAFKAATRDQPPAAGMRVVVDAAGYRERREQALSVKPTRLPRRPWTPAPRRTGRDERDRAQGRSRVPQGSRRRRDVLRGHRARPASRRRALELEAGTSPPPHPDHPTSNRVSRETPGRGGSPSVAVEAARRCARAAVRH